LGSFGKRKATNLEKGSDDRIFLRNFLSLYKV